MSEQEIATKHNIWKSSLEEYDYGVGQIQNQNLVQPQKELNLLGFKFDLETIKSKGYQNPKFVIYLVLALEATIILLVLIFYGYAANWRLLVFCPCLFGIIVGMFGLLGELNCSEEHSRTLKYYKSIEFFGAIFFNSSVVYSAIKQIPFKNIVLDMLVMYPIFLCICFVCCLCAKYYNSTNQSSQNNNFTNITINNINTSTTNKQLFQVRNASIQKIKRSQQEGGSLRGEQYQVNEWGIYRQRLGAGFVLSILAIDIMSDIYYGYILINTFGALSAQLLIFGITLIVCTAGDCVLLNYMAMFPGQVNYLAHVVAFVMEIPNFALTGISIWKLRDLMYSEKIEIENEQQLAVFSLVSTSINAFIHIVYIVDKWAVQSAVEFIQTRQSQY